VRRRRRIEITALRRVVTLTGNGTPSGSDGQRPPASNEVGRISSVLPKALAATAFNVETLTAAAPPEVRRAALSGWRHLGR
jgi:hypothetical protein